MRDKDAKIASCQEVVHELERNLEKLQQLISDAKKKGDSVQGVYTDCVEQLRRSVLSKTLKCLDRCYLSVLL